MLKTRKREGVVALNAGERGVVASIIESGELMGGKREGEASMESGELNGR